jgi:hypothetical protein
VLGVSATSYYRWRRAAASLRAVEGLSSSPPRPVTLYEALPEERQAVRAYALAHPEVRHRELAWRMVDEDVTCLSPRRCTGFCGKRSWYALATADEAEPGS